MTEEETLEINQAPGMILLLTLRKKLKKPVAVEDDVMLNPMQ